MKTERGRVLVSGKEKGVNGGEDREDDVCMSAYVYVE